MLTRSTRTAKQQSAAASPILKLPDYSKLYNQVKLEFNDEKIVRDSGLPDAFTRYFAEAADLNREAKDLIAKLTKKKIPSTPKKKVAATNKILEEISCFRRINFDDDDASFLSVQSPPKSSPAEVIRVPTPAKVNSSPARVPTPAKVNSSPARVPTPAKVNSSPARVPTPAKVNSSPARVPTQPKVNLPPIQPAAAKSPSRVPPPSKIKPPWKIPAKVCPPMPFPPPLPLPPKGKSLKRVLTPEKSSKPQSQVQTPAKKSAKMDGPAKKSAKMDVPAKKSAKMDVANQVPAKVLPPPARVPNPVKVNALPIRAPSPPTEVNPPPIRVPSPAKVHTPAKKSAKMDLAPVNKSSYDMTMEKIYLPSTETNYNVDDLSSNDETDDESQPKKTVPAWAKRQVLNPFVREMLKDKPLEVMAAHFGPINQPTLEALFNIHKSRYRNSSSIWQSPLHQPTVGFSRLPLRR